jgi:hypothetical protein
VTLPLLPTLLILLSENKSRTNKTHVVLRGASELRMTLRVWHGVDGRQKNLRPLLYPSSNAGSRWTDRRVWLMMSSMRSYYIVTIHNDWYINLSHLLTSSPRTPSPILRNKKRYFSQSCVVATCLRPKKTIPHV